MDIDLEQINAATIQVVKAEHTVRYTHHINPVNGGAVRERFFADWDAGAPSNPRFEYLPVLGDAAGAIDAARAALPRDPYWRELLGREVDRAADGLRALTTRDPAQLTEYALAQFGAPSEEAVEHARRYLDEHSVEAAGAAPAWSSQVVAESMRVVLGYAGLTEWTVEVSEHMAARMSVLGSSQLVRVRQGAQFTAAEIRRLMVHEIGTHVLRSANGRRQPLHILSHGVTGYMATEEGLAVWHEQQLGVTDVNVMRRYALRVIACHTALVGDFRGVFGALRPHTTADEAFDITLRVKRGLVDTSTPGGHIKDHVYFVGALDVGAHLAEHPHHHDLLLATKWPLAQIDTLRNWQSEGLVHPPTYAFTDVTRHIDRAWAATLSPPDGIAL